MKPVTSEVTSKWRSLYPYLHIVSSWRNRSLYSLVSGVDTAYVFIIRYHNMILSVTREFTELKHVNMIQRFTVVTVLLITVTTQINKTYSPPLALMFIIGIVSWEFNLCLSSELIDSGNERIFAAAYDNAWWICTNRVRRMLSFMMCRTRAANHIKLFGFLIVSYALIPETLRFSYSVYILLESSN